MNLGPQFYYKMGDHTTVAGMTGTGKTTLIHRLNEDLGDYHPQAGLYVADTKGAGDFAHYAEYVTRSAKAPAPLTKPGGIQVWQPPTDDLAEYDKWLTSILKAGKPAIVVIDELSSIGGTTGRSYPRGYQLLLKQGRGLRISVISGTQEAAYIPRQTLGQMTHLIRFRLLNKHDARTIDSILGRDEGEMGKEPTHSHGFIYRRLDVPGASKEYRDMRDFFFERAN